MLAVVRNLGQFGRTTVPTTPANSVTLSVAYPVDTYVATASWVVPASTPPVTAVLVSWSINGGAYSAETSLAATATTTTRNVDGNDTVVFRVRTLNSLGAYSAYVTSNTVTAPADRVTSLTATNSATPGTVTLTWVNPSGTITGTLIQRTVYDGTAQITTGTVTNLTAGAVTTFTDTPGASSNVDYAVRVTTAAGTSPGRGASVRTLPAVPTINSFTASNGGNLTMDATPVTHQNVSGYDVRLEIAGTWQTHSDTGSNPDHLWTNAVHGTSYRAGVRTRDAFGQVSAWATSSSVTAINDLVGPVVPVPTLTWNQGIGGFSISWGAITDALSSVSSASLEVLYEGAAWTQVSSVTAAGGSTTHACPLERRGQVVSYRIIATDSRGNTTQGTGASLTAKPFGTFKVSCAHTATWTAKTNTWRTDTSNVISGYFDNTYAQQTGYWFYANGIANTCKGYTPDSGSIIIIREGSQGFSGINKISPSNTLNTNENATYDVDNILDGPNLSGAGAFASYALSAGFLARMGTGYCRSVAAVNSAGEGSTSQSGYRVRTSVYSNVSSGELTLTFT